MESVLHIEPIVRHTQAPFSIGHSDYIFYGEQLTDDGENIGTPTANLRLGCPLKVADIRLGCPLETPDYGSTLTQIPLIKTIECVPDLSRNEGFVYSETLHYLKDRKYLIPFRSKLRSGLGQNLRISHLPSLNIIRKELIGMSNTVCDPRSEIVSDILLKDEIFHKNPNHPLKDWITEELTPSLSRKTTNELSFDTSNISSMINRYICQIHRTPSELNHQSLKDLTSIVALDSSLTPTRFLSEDFICRHLTDFRNSLTSHEINLKSLGRIKVDSLHRIEYNPFEFRQVCELFDHIPLTDFNVDIVLSPENDVIFYHEHIAVDRLGLFADNDAGLYTPKTIIDDNFNGQVLGDILKLFLDYHNGITEEIENIIYNHAIKIKIIKTITDEAAVFLYDVNGEPNDPPLCGVYFDIALLSLAPMSIMFEPIAN